MPKIICKGSERELIPADSIIQVKFVDCQVIDLDGQFGPWQKLEAEFEIVGVFDEDLSHFVGKPIWGSVPWRFTDDPDNELKQWVDSLLGMETGVGFELDTDLLRGRVARAIVENYTTKAGRHGHKVGALIGPAKATEPAQPAQQTLPGPESDEYVPF